MNELKDNMILVCKLIPQRKIWFVKISLISQTELVFLVPVQMFNPTSKFNPQFFSRIIRKETHLRIYDETMNLEFHKQRLKTQNVYL